MGACHATSQEQARDVRTGGQVHKDPALGGVVWHADGKGFTFTSLAGLQISGVWQVEITESPELAVSEPKLLFKPSGLASPAQLSSIATSRFRQCASDLPFDAIHLATALELGRDLTVLVTYDERMTAGAKQLGIRTTHPF